ncbi:hypothetical protein PM082_007242 [Marasmius tenuissimus]|nr:hypothetical protein PM082_007242 [Marasmius tenuissimus]
MASLQLLINAAMRESNYDVAIKRLGDRIQETTPPETLHKVILVFFHHLSFPPPRAAEFERDIHRIHTASLSLGALSRAISGNPQAVLPSRITPFWPSVWSWLSFFIAEIISDNRADSTFSRFDVEYSASSLVDNLLVIPEVAELMLKTNSFVPLITEFRLLDTRLHAESLRHLHHAFRTLQRRQHDWSCWQQQCLVVLNAKPVPTVSAFLGAIMREATSTTHEIDETSLSSNILMIIHFAALSSALSLAFVRSGASKWMARLIKRLTKVPFNPDTSHNVIGFMKGCISYIETQCQTHGYPCIVEAIDNRILESIYDAGLLIYVDLRSRLTVTGDRHLQDQCVELIRLIGCYASYIPVLRALRRSLSRVDRLQARTLPQKVEETFKLLRDVASLRIEDKRTCPSLSACGNPRCPNGLEDYLGPTRRCSGCTISLYCSKECQRASWKSAHRDQCKIIADIRAREGGFPRLGAVDQLGPQQTAFCFWQMENDSSRHLKSRSPDNPFEEERASRERHAGILVMRIDYRTLPPRVSFPTLEHCHSEDEDASSLNGLTGNVVVESLFSLSVPQQKEWDVWLSGNHGRYGRLVYGIFPHPKARRFSALHFIPEPRTSR